jgi:DNA-binding CsgD family transcriptional regulator
MPFITIGKYLTRCILLYLLNEKRYMIRDCGQYNLFFEVIKTYSSVGFKGIDRQDPLILSLEEMLKNNNQFLTIFDMLNMKNEFTTLGSIQMLGVKPEDLTSYHFKEATHPDDLKRHGLALVKLFKIANDLFIAKKGEMVISSDFRLRNPTGMFTNQLIQCLLFYCPKPIETVILFNINTDISWHKKKKYNFYFYVGNDLSYFRYPDEELLLKMGNLLTDREFEIIKLIEEGHDSEQIADKLFLSRHTVNTHRKNILAKTGKAHISDLIYFLKEQGLL